MKALDPLELATLIEKNLITEQGLSEVVLCLRQLHAEKEALKHWQDTWRPFIKKHFGVKE